MLGPSWAVLGPLGVLRHLGSSCAVFGAVLGLFWGVLGASWGHLGPSCRPLGGVLGRLGGVLGPPGGQDPTKARATCFWRPLGAVLASFLGSFWIVFGVKF